MEQLIPVYNTFDINAIKKHNDTYNSIVLENQKIILSGEQEFTIGVVHGIYESCGLRHFCLKFPGEEPDPCNQYDTKYYYIDYATQSLKEGCYLREQYKEKRKNLADEVQQELERNLNSRSAKFSIHEEEAPKGVSKTDLVKNATPLSEIEKIEKELAKRRISTSAIVSRNTKVLHVTESSSPSTQKENNIVNDDDDEMSCMMNMPTFDENSDESDESEKE